MREKNRKPIASYIKLPQFTTMNVIDGQAGLIIYASLIFYSLTIDNILNIIVLLILAGVTIATLTGDNGLLTKAGEAKNTTVETEGLEKIQIAVIASYDEKGINTNLLAKNLNQINGLTDTNNQLIADNIEITLPKIIKLNNIKYIIEKDGNVDTLLPYKYTECKYLESIGTQYLNTGYIPTENTDINIEYRLPSWYNHNQRYALLGSNNLAIEFNRYSGSLSTIFKKGKNEIDINKWGFTYKDVYNMSILKNEIKLVTSQGIYTGTVEVDFTDTQSLPMFLWAVNEGNGAIKKISGRIYYFTIFENSSIVAYLVPALDQNNRPCMFDAIRRKTFYNQGSGEFGYELEDGTYVAPTNN